MLRNEVACQDNHFGAPGRLLCTLCQELADSDCDATIPKNFSVSSTASLPERTQSGTPMPL